ncbi:hypothetical protein AYO49_00515 [Verrucomicrobiaceae bacterium SCGC AG-212-N21]|nr:hypothetical protein AYO49_00515 [Verrucomicrobiaceae bacterium SCGC AG-212-N21]
MESEPPRLEAPPKPNNWISRCRQFFLWHWRPEPLDPPKVDPEILQLSGPERAAEVVRYSVFSAEFWLSPKGNLREWLRFNTKVASMLFVPALLVVPLITFTLGQFKTWIDLLVATTTGMVLFPLSALLVVGLISAVVYLARSFSRRHQRRDPYYYQ